MYQIRKYNSAKTFSKALKKSIKNLEDCVIVNNTLYTMDSYDLEGKEVTYGNVKYRRMLTVNNFDRYKNTKDTKVKIEELLYYRNDIQYLQ